MASSSSSTVEYPHPLGVNVKEFVTVELSPLNYDIWKSMMLDLLAQHGLTGFIDGSISPPPEKTNGINGEEDNPNFSEWKKSDGLVRRWILATVHERLLFNFHHLPTAKDIWTAIQKLLLKPFHHELTVDHEETMANLGKYIPLSTAALHGDWEKAKEFLDNEPDAARAFITGASETALMIATRSINRFDVFRELLVRMNPTDLALRDKHGMTALHIAANSGNIKVAQLLVAKNPSLPNIADKSRRLPLHLAAICCEREMVLYLLSATKDNVEPKLFEGESGNKLMHGLVQAGLYDIALVVLNRQPHLACEEPTPLEQLAVKRSSFKSGLRLNLYQHFIYSWVPLKLENIDQISTSEVGIQTMTTSNSLLDILKPKFQELFWKIAENYVPQIRRVRETKTVNHQALELVKRLCSEIVKLEDSKASKILKMPVFKASKEGVHEVIEEILGSYPSAIYLADELNMTLFHHGIYNRCENIFNIIYQIEHKHLFLRMQTKGQDNCLHMAGRLGSQQKFNLRDGVAGAGLQVQRELQWFEAVKKFILEEDREELNFNGDTPKMCFTMSHKNLVRDGEKWMKDTSSSCTIVAVLIVTIVFAAAITVPGGYNDTNGYPNFESEQPFRVFAIADALALFASTSSVIMFLSILTSRYGEYDFLYALPKRLIIGLVTLFLSIIFMMIAFGATIQIVFGRNRPWILLPVVAFSSVSVMLFVFLQFPLLWVMIKSTYRPGIFGKQSNRILF